MSARDRPPRDVPFPDAFGLDPSPTWTWLQEHEPVARARTVAGHDVWLVTGYDAVRTVLADPRFSRAAALRQGGPHAAAVAPRPGTLTALDPPEHTRLRTLVSGAFAHRRIEALRPTIGDLAATAVGNLVRSGAPADLRAHVAAPVPLQVVCALLGVEAQDRFRAWADALYSVSGSRHADDAYRGLEQVLADAVAVRRARPRPDPDDLLDVLVAARDGADRITETELVSFSLSLLMAGYETTASSIGSAVVELLREPARWAALVARPALVPAAVEELLRINRLSETGQVRVALTDVELAGTVVRAGDGVLAAIGAANRDAAAFTDPDEYRPQRSGPRHLTFGLGPHYCLGAHLARIELVEVLRALLTRLPRLHLAVPAAEVAWRRSLIRGPVELPVRW